MGNPPFVGYSNQNETQKQELIDCAGRFIKNAGSLDYVSGWYFKASNYIRKQNVFCAFVSTNSICQGEQATWLWKPLFDQGVHINFGYRTFIWNNQATDQAHVHCVIVGFSEKNLTSKRLFTTHQCKEVSNINAYLTDAPSVFVQSRNEPLCETSLGKMQLGIDPTDYGNLTFSDEDKQAFILAEPASEMYFKQYLDSRSFLHGVKRWYLDLTSCTEEDFSRLPLCAQRVENVIYERSQAQSEATRKRANQPLKPKQGWVPTTDYLIVPRVSSERRLYIPMGFCDRSIVSSMANQVIPNGTIYHYGVLQSLFHNAWMRVVAGRLKSDYRYSAGIVYNNFIWPDPTSEQRETIEKCAQSVLDARANHPGKSLADLYDPDKMPDDLLKAHQALDAAVEAAYGVDFNGDEEKIVAHLFKLYAEKTSGK